MGDARSVDASGPPDADDRRYEEITVHYATHRNRERNTDPSKAFGNRREQISYGAVKVTVPFDRAVGSLGDASLFSFVKGPKKDRMILVDSVLALGGADELAASLRANITKGEATGEGRSEAFIFIHGHDTSFDDAARRTAQLAVDIDMRHGGVFYSWPAGTLFQYQFSERQVTEQHVRDLKEFFATDRQ